MTVIETELFPGFKIGDRHPVRIMGIINLSPESFYPDSFTPKENLRDQITNFIKNGASFIDLGARSTAPWSEPISIEEEISRMEQALLILPEIIPKDDVVVSIDTQYAKVAALALKFGKLHNLKMILNDISCFRTDPHLLDIVIEYNCPVLLMASLTKPGDAKNPMEVMQAWRIAIQKLQERGYDVSQVVIDPGIGKWVKEKTYEFDLAILDLLGEFRRFKLPILVGLSRKSFIGTVLNEKDPRHRDIGSLSATAIAVYNGAHIIRTHDVDKNVIQTILMASSIRPKSYVEESLSSNALTSQDIKKLYQKDFP